MTFKHPSTDPPSLSIEPSQVWINLDDHDSVNPWAVIIGGTNLVADNYHHLGASPLEQ
jgi:hypothetical protein